MFRGHTSRQSSKAKKKTEKKSCDFNSFQKKVNNDSGIDINKELNLYDRIDR